MFGNTIQLGKKNIQQVKKFFIFLKIIKLGDTLFANTFKENLQHVYIYNDKIVWNPQENIYSWFQVSFLLNNK